jgi:hypothetical protein
VNAALAEAPDDRRVINLLAGAESIRRCGDVPDNWQKILVALVGASWTATLPPAARNFVSPRWKHIELVAIELLF